MLGFSAYHTRRNIGSTRLQRNGVYTLLHSQNLEHTSDTQQVLSASPVLLLGAFNCDSQARSLLGMRLELFEEIGGGPLCI